MTTYLPKKIFQQPDVNTIVPFLFRSPRVPSFVRQRVELEDGDFLDLDWIKRGHNKLIIQTHGMEGNSKTNYIKGMIKKFMKKDCDFLAWNLRSCSGELNRLKTFYHSGFSQDLRQIVNLALPYYDEIYLIGYSLGANITLKYLAEEGTLISPKIKKSSVVSVPWDLASTAEALARVRSKVYMEVFLLTLKQKLRKKMKIHDYGELDLKKVMKCRSFIDFDELVTAPLFKYQSAQDYWEKNSSLKMVSNIALQTLVINAKDDPFLGDKCFPKLDQLGITTLYPEFGGHVGFFQNNSEGSYWHEDRTFDFFTSI